MDENAIGHGYLRTNEGLMGVSLHRDEAGELDHARITFSGNSLHRFYLQLIAKVLLYIARNNLRLFGEIGEILNQNLHPLTPIKMLVERLREEVARDNIPTICPECAERSLELSEGVLRCYGCGYSEA